MPTHVRDAIAAGIVTELKKIGVGAGWNLGSTPDVKRYSADVLRQEEFPAVWVVTASEALTELTFGSAQGKYVSTVRFEVHAWISSFEIDAAVSGLLHDVMKALGRDRTFGGKCISSAVNGSETMVSETDTPYGGFVLTLEALVRYKADDPAVTVP